jgi:hypothetical protein
MKKFLVMALMLTVAQGAMAEHTPDHKGEGKKGPRGGEKMFSKIDTNNDGVITKDEMIAFHSAEFDKVDADKDGKLTKEEMKTFHKAQKEERKAKMEEWKKNNPDAGKHKGKGPRGEKGEKPVDAPEAPAAE